MKTINNTIDEIDVFEYDAYKKCISFYKIFEKIVESEEEFENNSELLNSLLYNLVYDYNSSKLLIENLNDSKSDEIYKLLVYTSNLAENIYKNLDYCFRLEMDKSRYDVTIYIASEYCEMYKNKLSVWEQLVENYESGQKRVNIILVALAAAGIIAFAAEPYVSQIINKVQEYIEFNNEEQSYDFSDIEEKLGVKIPIEEDVLKRERVL